MNTKTRIKWEINILQNRLEILQWQVEEYKTQDNKLLDINNTINIKANELESLKSSIDTKVKELKMYEDKINEKAEELNKILDTINTSSTKLDKIYKAVQDNDVIFTNLLNKKAELTKHINILDNDLIEKENLIKSKLSNIEKEHEKELNKIKTDIFNNDKILVNKKSDLLNIEKDIELTQKIYQENVIKLNELNDSLLLKQKENDFLDQKNQSLIKTRDELLQWNEAFIRELRRKYL